MKKNWPYLLLIGLGLLQSIGYIFSVPLIRGLGAASVASPLPLVFSHFRGLETFSSKFHLKLTLDTNETKEFELTPELYDKFPGPYNRRNVYGAVVAYGTELKEHNERELVHYVLSYAFCNPAILAKSLGVEAKIKHAVIDVVNPVSQQGNYHETLEVPCTP